MSDHSIIHIRPRFSLEVDCSFDVMEEKINGIIDASANDLSGTLRDGFLSLNVLQKDLHFWSPHLTARIEPNEWNTNKVTIRGMIGPRPAVWTMFTFFYFSIGTISFFVSLYATSIWSLGEFSHLIWAFPIAVLFMLTAYLAGKYGEKLGHDQTEMLKDVIRRAIQGFDSNSIT